MTYQRKRAVAVNDRGHVIGQDHHRARLTDHEIDLVRELRAEGMALSEIADKFEISTGYASDLCKGRYRGHLAVDQKLLPPSPARPIRRRPARPEEFDDFG